MATKKKMLQAAAGVGGGDIGAWDVSYAYYDDPFAWDISNSIYIRNFSISGQETVPEGIFFKPDGTKMYIAGGAGSDINEYSLSTAWNISSASYIQNFSVATEDVVPGALFFKPDGLKMYITGRVSDYVYEYNLSTAWDISTASYSQNFSVAAQETNPNGLFFKPDGTKMYIVGSVNDEVIEYDLSTAWDISTASHLQSYSVQGREAVPEGVFFKPDGLKMYIIGSSGDEVNEYNLSTAWDISTSQYSQVFSVQAQDTIPQAIFFKTDGSGFYVAADATDLVLEYNLGGFSVAAEELSPRGIFFDSDGLTMYIIGTQGDDMNEYSLSTAYDTSTASYVRRFDTGTVEGVPTDLFFKPDGTALYLCGQGLDGVSQWSLSTPWNVSTLSHVQTINLSAQSAIPTGLFFKPDGTEMYVVHQAATIIVSQYSLSTAWDISTASHLQNFDVNTNSAGGSSVSFKPDGTKMYVTGTTSRTVAEYDLSTAWDISTASYSQSFSLLEQDTAPQGIFFHPEGTQMFMVGSVSDRVHTYSLGVQP